MKLIEMLNYGFITKCDKYLNIRIYFDTDIQEDHIHIGFSYEYILIFVCIVFFIHMNEIILCGTLQIINSFCRTENWEKSEILQVIDWIERTF